MESCHCHSSGGEEELLGALVESEHCGLLCRESQWLSTVGVLFRCILRWNTANGAQQSTVDPSVRVFRW